MKPLIRRLLLVIFLIPQIVHGQEVIRRSGSVVLPEDDGGNKIVGSGQSLSVTSNTSIILRPGFQALQGSTVSLRIGTGVYYAAAPEVGNADPTLNWIKSRALGLDGQIVGESKVFYDLSGQLLQRQVRNLTYGHVLASQPLYDRMGRPAIQTLSAPINNSMFSYKSNFVTNGTGQKYLLTNFDTEAKLNAPDAVGNNTIGTLGWYYSDNNTADNMVPATGIPYSRTDFLKDGSADAGRAAGIGDALKMGSGHEAFGGTLAVQNELSHYLSVRDRFFNDANMGQTGQGKLTGNAVLSAGRDAQGSWAIGISDKDGKALVSGIPGNWLTVSNTVHLSSYNHEYTLSSTSGDYLRNIKVNGPGTLKVYEGNNMLYEGSFAAYTPPTTMSSGTVYRFTSDQAFVVSYKAVYATGGVEPVCDDCTSQLRSSVLGQHFHYFALAQQGSLGVTNGTVSVVNLATDQVMGDLNALPAGIYKAIATGGEPQLNYTNQLSDLSYNFYDQKGQLVASIPPNGVQQLITNGVNAYADKTQLPFVTLLEYDRQGQLMASNSPDAGRSEFIYRKDGAIRFSQNAEQRKTGRFSYTNYDDSSRPVESGEYQPGDISFENAKTNTALLESTAADGGLTGGSRNDWSRTHYDVADNGHGQSGYVQDFIEGAVSWTEGPNSKTWYSYDEQGKLTWSIKWINGLGYKTVDYNYDFLGNVTTVAYQKNVPGESFYHHYTYDADQRLSNVRTSRDGSSQLQQAAYYYYLHGPLKRIELGDGLQGIDHTYTAQGMLKSINHASGDPSRDPGHDGGNGFAADAFSLQMEYFNGDYYRSGSGITSVTTGQSSYYNGNVNGISWQSKKPQSVLSVAGMGIQAPSAYSYNYDNKYQLSNATWGTPDLTGGGFTPGAQFREQNLSYDPNGNIKTLQRTNAAGTLSDDFNIYQYQAGTNKLQNVNGYASYTYDDLGQLKSAQQAGVPFTMYLKYDVSGKITGVYANEALTDLKVSYTYDEAGNRISRTDLTGSVPAITYYMYDPSSNILAIYNGSNIIEAPIYGSGRLGTYTYASNAYAYELRDNVGSVRVVINRNKKADGTVDVLSYNDYYPYGSIARNGGVGYRYEYQGAYAEKDPITGWNNFNLRMYDGRLGRWLSTDPKGQYASPYVGMGNDPVNRVDPDGGEDGPGPKDKIKVPVNPKTGLITATGQDMIMTFRKMSPSEIYYNRVARGVDPFSGPNGDRIRQWSEWYDEMYADYTKKMNPSIEGLVLNYSVNTRILNFQGSFGLAKGNETKFFYGFTAAWGYSNNDMPLVGRGAGYGFSLNYFAGYEVGDNVNMKNGFVGWSKVTDVTLGPINFGRGTPLDPLTGHSGTGYNVVYYGLGSGYNVNYGLNRTSWLKN